MKIAIIDYGSGNLHSVASAFEHIKAKSADDISIVISDNPKDLQDSTHILLPGVGTFHDCMSGLSSLDGMIDALNHNALEQKKPFLGICVGMQMLMEKGYEHKECEGLGWIKGDVILIEPNDPSLKIPHMGWNNLDIKTKNHKLFNGIDSGDHAYFVHSYQVKCADDSNVIACTDYGDEITAAIAKDNIMGIQFHPEKSHLIGEKILANFLKL